MLTALEMPLNVIERADCPYVNKAEGIGGVPKSTYIELRVVFPKLILAHEEDLSDDSERQNKPVHSHFWILLKRIFIVPQVVPEYRRNEQMGCYCF
jgi:hypothetical protein